MDIHGLLQEYLFLMMWRFDADDMVSETSEFHFT
jgi:hypothetical protein